MSATGDPRDYRSIRNDNRGLPPLREIVGDALDRPPRSPYDFDLGDVHRALPNSSKRYSSPGTYYPSRGPTLPPIRRATSRSYSSHSESSSARSAGHTPSSTGHPGSSPHDLGRHPPDAPNTYTYTTPHPQPATGPSSYSFNVLRAQQGDLVDVRTPSSRAQGILRPTAIIEDEDESHKRYKCQWPGCEKKYDRPSSLEVHKHTHTGTQPYPCQYEGCDRAFNVKSNMLRHFRSHPQVQHSQSSETRDDSASDEDKWPSVEQGPTARYFHNSTSSSHRPSSSSSLIHTSSSGSTASTSSTASPPSNTYYRSSRRS